MGVKALISEEEYLQVTFDGPEPDFVNGEILERGMPNTFHSLATRKLCRLLAPIEDRTGLCALPEIRVRTADGKFRVIDLAVFLSVPKEAIPASVPLIAIEIVSPDDRLDDIFRKLMEYQNCGVAHIVLADPALRTLSIYRDGSLTSVETFVVPEFEISISVDDLFMFKSHA